MPTVAVLDRRQLFDDALVTTYRSLGHDHSKSAFPRPDALRSISRFLLAVVWIQVTVKRSHWHNSYDVQQSSVSMVSQQVKRLGSSIVTFSVEYWTAINFMQHVAGIFKFLGRNVMYFD